MAKLRRVLAAGLAGMGQSVSDFLQRRQLAEEQREGVARAAREKEDQDSLNRIFEEFLKQNPLQAAGVLGRKRQHDDIAAPIAGDISKADDERKALTEEDIAQRFTQSGGRPTLNSRNFTRGVEVVNGRKMPALQSTDNPGGESVLAGLQAQGKSRREMLRAQAEQPDRTIAEARPDGSFVTRGVNPRTMGEVTTGLSAAQQGANEATKKLGAEYDPRLTAAETAKQVAIEKGTRPGQVARAGAISAAQTEGRLGVEYNAKYTAARINETKERAIAEAAAAANRQNALAANEAAAHSLVANQALGQITQKWNKVKLGPGYANNIARAGRRAGRMTGMQDVANPDVAALDSEVEAYSMLLYRAFGGTGSGVSDRDLTFMQAGLPFSWKLAEVGDKILKDSSIMLSFPTMIRARYGTLPFEKQMEIANSWLKLNDTAAEKGATFFEDPFSPGKMIQVIK